MHTEGAQRPCTLMPQPKEWSVPVTLNKEVEHLTIAPEDIVIASLITDLAQGPLICLLPLQAVAFYPLGSVIVSYRLYHSGLHDGARSKCALCIDAGSIVGSREATS